jgi:ribosomal protein S21
MALEIKRKQKENAQAMLRRFQKAVQQSGVLLEVRRRQFVKRTKSANMQKKSALRKLETKKKYETIRKMRKV